MKNQKGVQYVFTGPTIFIVASLDSRDFELHLEFEGVGKLVEKDTFFTHETLHANSGCFSNTELKTWNFSPLLFTKLNDKSNYTLDYTTLVVSNFSGMALFQAKLGNGECSNEDSFIIISDMMENSTKVTE
ncbi:unnamed protein product [Orchesella dallaii]|uniref:Uncharacterized protein n=1 Tax=Orchesella dallaii TaxID=48710 RepID=A0ABP1PK08_9HEXA